jgi:hypothetical protein
MARENLLKFRRGTAQEWAAANPTLDAGEPGFESNTQRFKVGDGNTTWNNLKYVGFDGGNLDLGTPYIEATPPGLNVQLDAFAQTGSSVGVGLTFSNVSGSGTTTVAKIEADASSPNLPGNFSLSNSLGSYNITTTATFVGNVIIEFVLPSNVTQQVFDSVRIFKLTSGVTTDVTVLNGQYAPDFATRTVYASVTSFSEFYIIPSVAPAPTTTVAPTTTTVAPTTTTVAPTTTTVAPTTTTLAPTTTTLAPTTTTFAPTTTTVAPFSAQSVILSSDSNYTVPNGAKVIKIWSIGAGGTSTYPCDGGATYNGNPGVVSYRHGFISNTGVVVSGAIGQPASFVCSSSTPGGSTTLSNLSTVINPSISSLVGGGGGMERGQAADRTSSGGLSTYTLWSNSSTRRDYVGINSVINAAGGNASNHTYGRGGSGYAGAIVMQFLPATDLVLPFTGSGSFTIPSGYSSVKIWAVGSGGIGTVYCDGGPNTAGGAGGISFKTWSVSAGDVINYSAAPQLTGINNWCLSSVNGSSSTATLNGTTITGGAGLGNGTNGSGTGGDGSGVAGNDVSSINAAYLSYATGVQVIPLVVPLSTAYSYPGTPGNENGNYGGIVLVKFMV